MTRRFAGTKSCPGRLCVKSTWCEGLLAAANFAFAVAVTTVSERISYGVVIMFLVIMFCAVLLQSMINM